MCTRVHVCTHVRVQVPAHLCHGMHVEIGGQLWVLVLDTLDTGSLM